MVHGERPAAVRGRAWQPVRRPVDLQSPPHLDGNRAMSRLPCGRMPHVPTAGGQGRERPCDSPPGPCRAVAPRQRLWGGRDRPPKPEGGALAMRARARLAGDCEAAVSGLRLPHLRREEPRFAACGVTPNPCARRFARRAQAGRRLTMGAGRTRHACRRVTGKRIRGDVALRRRAHMEGAGALASPTGGLRLPSMLRAPAHPRSQRSRHPPPGSGAGVERTQSGLGSAGFAREHQSRGVEMPCATHLV